MSGDRCNVLVCKTCGVLVYDYHPFYGETFRRLHALCEVTDDHEAYGDDMSEMSTDEVIASMQNLCERLMVQTSVVNSIIDQFRFEKLEESLRVEFDGVSDDDLRSLLEEEESVSWSLLPSPPVQNRTNRIKIELRRRKKAS